MMWILTTTLEQSYAILLSVGIASVAVPVTVIGMKTVNARKGR